MKVRTFQNPQQRHPLEGSLSSWIENSYPQDPFFLSLGCAISKKLIFPQAFPSYQWPVTAVIPINGPPLCLGRLTESQEDNWPSQWQDAKENINYHGSGFMLDADDTL